MTRRAAHCLVSSLKGNCTLAGLPLFRSPAWQSLHVASCPCCGSNAMVGSISCRSGSQRHVLHAYLNQANKRTALAYSFDIRIK